MRRGAKRGWAVLVVALAVLGVLTAFAVILGGALRTQVTSLIDNAPGLLEDLRRNRTVAHLDAKYHVISALEDRLRSPDFATTTFGGIFQAGLSVLNAVVGLIIVAILTLYFLSDLPRLKRVAYSLAPASRRERVAKLGDEIVRRVGRYVIGSAVVALIAGTVTLIFLFIVGLGEYALPLALLVALLDLVPMVGAIIGAASVCIVGLATSLPVGVACIIFYLVYETLEGYVIYPRVMRSSVDVPEYVTIVAVLVGGCGGRDRRCPAGAAHGGRVAADHARGLGASPGRVVSRAPAAARSGARTPGVRGRSRAVGSGSCPRPPNPNRCSSRPRRRTARRRTTATTGWSTRSTPRRRRSSAASTRACNPSAGDPGDDGRTAYA